MYNTYILNYGGNKMKKAVKTFAFICLTLFGSICAFSAPFEATVVSAKGKTEVQRAGCVRCTLKTEQ